MQEADKVMLRMLAAMLRVGAGVVTLLGVFIVGAGGAPFFEFRGDSEYLDVTANLAIFLSVGIGGYILSRGMELFADADLRREE